MDLRVTRRQALLSASALALAGCATTSAQGGDQTAAFNAFLERYQDERVGRLPELATRLGDIGLSRAVGQALGRNPFPIVVPCHRVLAAGGKSGGFSAPGGVDTKRRMLEIEGARDLQPTLPWDSR